MKFISWIFSPAFFGVAFLGPLLGQSMVAVGLMSNDYLTMGLGLLLGAAWGLMAQLRGSWIWIRP